MPFQTNMINSIIEEARKYLYEQPWIEFKLQNMQLFLSKSTS